MDRAYKEVYKILELPIKCIRGSGLIIYLRKECLTVTMRNLSREGDLIKLNSKRNEMSQYQRRQAPNT